MNSAELLYNVTENDECYTPDYGVKPILKHIIAYKQQINADILTVWAPFDDKNSEFVKQISLLEGVKVVHSHIFTGQDFFEYEPKEWDIIVSNPPFKNKRAYFERALSFGKPICLLMSLATLNDKNPAWCFKEAGKELQLLKFDKRIHFNKLNEGVSKRTTFSSGYFCCDFLQSNLILEEM